jgi:hypothetical protein
MGWIWDWYSSLSGLTPPTSPLHSANYTGDGVDPLETDKANEKSRSHRPLLQLIHQSCAGDGATTEEGAVRSSVDKQWNQP